MRKLRLLFVLSCAAGCTAGCAQTAGRATVPDPVFHQLPMAAERGWPFSAAVQAGPILYLSGEIGVGADGKLVAGGITAEARRTMDNIGATLARYGASFDDLIQCQVMLTDIADWPAFNVVYRTYFNEHFPARSAFAGSGLALGARVEVQCNAWHPVGQRGGSS